MVSIALNSFSVSFFILAMSAHIVVVFGSTSYSYYHIEELALKENQLLRTLYDHITSQQANLNLLSQKYEQLAKHWQNTPVTDLSTKDPISAYSLVRRLAREWPLVLTLMSNTNDMLAELSSLPGEEVLKDAVKGLTRLQLIYGLNCTQLATHLTAQECFEIGNFLLKWHKYETAYSWFLQAVEKAMKGDTTEQTNKILLHLLVSIRKSKCTGGAKSDEEYNKWAQFLLSQNPNFKLDQESALLYKQSLLVDCSASKRMSLDVLGSELSELYRKSCNGHSPGNIPSNSSELRCFYVHYNNPRLLIAPFKMEELHLDPPLLMFHEVISDDEILHMRLAFNERRGPCQVVRQGDEEDEYIENYRKCDAGWMEDYTSETTWRLATRVGDMTNLFMGSSEQFQVASYGLGGEYLIHHDNVEEQSLPEYIDGRRIATLMFYLSDVESGGYTVFPNIGVNVKPQKGSAAFWFNLDHKSEALVHLLHGACPVLSGSKLVLNKWIHETGQKAEFFCPVDEVFPKKRYYLNGIKSY